ncbi:MAG: hypothetical protein IJT12_02700 [Paludibacteraceae bacterium]|nr:hypothetical protein [Paludibacteraceae bacterium]
MRSRLLLILLPVIMFAGCRKRPLSLFKGDHEDTAAIMDIVAIQQKAIEAENEVITVAKADSSLRWVQHQHGWWYCFTNQDYEYNDYLSLLNNRDTCRLIHETVYDLEGNLIVDAVREFDSSADEPVSYIFMLREMLPGDTVVMLIPWTLAYGTNGNMFVRPYTSIRTQLTIHTSPYTDIEIIEDTIANKEL